MKNPLEFKSLLITVSHIIIICVIELILYRGYSLNHYNLYIELIIYRGYSLKFNSTKRNDAFD